MRDVGQRVEASAEEKVDGSVPCVLGCSSAGTYWLHVGGRNQPRLEPVTCLLWQYRRDELVRSVQRRLHDVPRPVWNLGRMASPVHEQWRCARSGRVLWRHDVPGAVSAVGKYGGAWRRKGSVAWQRASKFRQIARCYPTIRCRRDRPDGRRPELKRQAK